jgi:hypothetical protein
MEPKKFITAFTEDRHCFLSWARWIQSTFWNIISSGSVLIISYSLCLLLSNGLWASVFPTKIFICFKCFLRFRKGKATEKLLTRFNIKTPCIFRNFLFTCFEWFSQQTIITSPNNIHDLVFIIEASRVSCKATRQKIFTSVKTRK